MSSSVLPTLGAALAGSMIAVGLSAVLGFQTFLYFQIFPSDAHQYKFLHGFGTADTRISRFSDEHKAPRIADAVHTALVCTGVWQYIILNFAHPEIVENIFPVIAITVAMTAVITLSAVLSIVRVGLAFGTLKFINVDSPDSVLFRRKATTTEMLLSKTFPAFAARFKILFTSGLAISAITDVIVSGARYYFLRNLRQGYSMPHEAVDAVVVFTINDGCLTCAVVIVSIVCWLSMPHNFVYLGIYFTIAKFYANSVLATLNLRNWYRHRYIVSRPIGLSTKHPLHVNGGHDSNLVSPGTNSNLLGHPVQSADVPPKMQVFVDHQVEYVNDFPRKDHEDGHSNLSRNSVVEIA
ncbi:hypothetical protein C8F04DRAFT_1268185 [Mycena alexandri]|uniref:DUF6534 domain-containing protein n=1 Tax=Mycena alexandri TaxID=1745969 RepID=A0AAD6WZ42_9AGAR|nr:hypothetical protein C8F04DRAFT_1268185 [Mycena alexandri]